MLTELITQSTVHTERSMVTKQMGSSAVFTKFIVFTELSVDLCVYRVNKVNEGNSVYRVNKVNEGI